MQYAKFLLLPLFLTFSTLLWAQVDQVNVFLGSSGDHGQLSPAASSPFHQLSIVPQTNPTLHMGYEFLAKEVVGFTHNRMEGVGCKGSGGLILVKPHLADPLGTLHKSTENAGPGFYEIGFKEQITTKIAVVDNFGMHQYHFPKGKKGFTIDLAHAFNGAFVSNEFRIHEGIISGKLRSKTTCNVGIYTIYYAIAVSDVTDIQTKGNVLQLTLQEQAEDISLRIAFSAVDESYAIKTLSAQQASRYSTLKKQAAQRWDDCLSSIQVQGGDAERAKLFYSLLYRTMQSPFMISESDGAYRATDGALYRADSDRYHGWAIWDNYKTQLPLLELALPGRYQAIVSSVSDLYRYGKHDFAGPYEPANSVRTEHAAVVLLDALKKGYTVPLEQIKDKLIADTARFDFSKPDKYLEAAYDMWAMSQLFKGKEAKHFQTRAMTYKHTWNTHFQNLKKDDVDRMSARNMYQGTIRQYRWNVPFDVQGLSQLMGGQSALTAQLDDFFDNYYFNRANEPDIQSPTLYLASDKPWRYQSLVQQLALDTVVQYYFNDNSRGIDAHIDRIYKNEPKAFIRTMDDDAGAMSGWFVMTAIGMQQALVGAPVYYLSVPLFPKVVLHNAGRPIRISVQHFSDQHPYIKRVRWNGKDLGRTWITRQELAAGGTLEIEASAEPTTYGQDNRYISEVKP